MQDKKIVTLAIALLMFPQIAQTLYSPALADFGRTFSITPAVAAQAITVYFLAFALGVVVWGRACDHFGRRVSMLCGLALFGFSSAAAVFVQTFQGLLIAQGFAAFGAAVGSVVTQTILRDRFSGADLSRLFSIAGMVLAASPAIGLFAGATVVHQYGYPGVMVSLAGIATLLIVWTATALPETKPQLSIRTSLMGTACLMARDLAIWRSALQVAVFNIALLSYYSLGPFVFQHLHLSNEIYGYSGIVLAFGAALGSWLNKRMLRRVADGEKVILVASVLLLLGGVGVQALKESAWFLLPMLLSVIAFGLAIPNVLSKALNQYRDRLGTAGALFGLAYYMMIGAGIGCIGASQALGSSLIVCGFIALLLCSHPLLQRQARCRQQHLRGER